MTVLYTVGIKHGKVLNEPFLFQRLIRNDDNDKRLDYYMPKSMEWSLSEHREYEYGCSDLGESIRYFLSTAGEFDSFTEALSDSFRLARRNGHNRVLERVYLWPLRDTFFDVQEIMLTLVLDDWINQNRRESFSYTVVLAE